MLEMLEKEAKHEKQNNHKNSGKHSLRNKKNEKQGGKSMNCNPLTNLNFSICSGKGRHKQILNFALDEKMGIETRDFHSTKSKKSKRIKINTL